MLCRFPVVLLHCSVLPVQKPNSVWSLWTLCNYVMDDEYGPSRKRGPSRKLLAARYDGEYMIHRFVWGGMAATEMQTIAALLKRDLEFAIALQMSVKIDRILDDYPDEFTLPPAAASEFQGAVFVYLNQVTSLANRFNSAGRMVFNITVKTHCLAHFGCRVHCLNPRRGVFRVNVLCSSSEKS